ncbi:MAG: hypothetical protein QOF98_3348 [Streptomyces sp.]|nr:hypothetical protein [Streptomyces sp.]
MTEAMSTPAAPHTPAHSSAHPAAETAAIGLPTLPTPPPPVPPLLAHASRAIDKATLVPLNAPPPVVGQAVVKTAFVQQLGLRAGEVAAVADGVPSADHDLLGLLASFEAVDLASTLPSAAEFATVPASALREFGQAVADLRRQEVERFSPAAKGAATKDAATEAAATAPEPLAGSLGEAQHALHSAAVAVRGLEVNTSTPRLGWMNLERLEMAPNGIERGELLATIPLAPLEETAVTQKEWSVQKKEFTSIVTDSLETVSETGVTDNTELSQSTTSQQEHANQFNITGTVSGGIPVISGSASSGFTAQGSQSQSATDSRKHATTLTQKASTRAKQEHKVTITTTTETGTSQSTTRTLKNSSSTDPIRIDYFSLMRKWRVRLYRYGLRLTYDIVLPEPAASMRQAYVELAALKDQLGPFVFNVAHNDITAEVRDEDPAPPVTHPPTPKEPHYLVLADRLGAQGLPHPPDELPAQTYAVETGALPDGRAVTRTTLNLPAGYEIVDITIGGHITSYADNHRGQFTIVGSTLSWDSFAELIFPPGTVLKQDTDPTKDFMAGATGAPTLVLVWDECSTQSVLLTVRVRPARLAVEQWQSDVWNALFNAAQTQYYAQQQDIAGRIAALEARLTDVDTLTLRREESDEVMKAVLRYLLGGRFPTMPPEVAARFAELKVDLAHGTGFDSNAVGADTALWTLVQQYEDIVRFVNQAIEWENVVSFLYSYFWDLPESWAFVRGIQHPDANRQAFLRAGSARVVLTVRKGWETRWVNFVENGVIDDPGQPSSPSLYWTIAQEIAAYDDRNYPGIPPANPGRTATRLEDAVFTTSAVTVGPSAQPVTIPVASSDGFVVGLGVLIDAVRDTADNQESQLITAIPDGTHIQVAKLTKAHTGTAAAPFPVMQPGEKGELIAEWNEYTPTSGTDIAVTSNLSTIA